MAIADNWKRTSTITHGATTFAQAIGGSVQATVDWIVNRPGVSTAPEARAVEKFDCEADVRFQGVATPIVIATSATLTYTLESYDATTGTLALATMYAGAPGWDFNSISDAGAYVQMQKFHYTGSSLAPWTVTP